MQTSDFVLVNLWDLNRKVVTCLEIDCSCHYTAGWVRELNLSVINEHASDGNYDFLQLSFFIKRQDLQKEIVPLLRPRAD